MNKIGNRWKTNPQDETLKTFRQTRRTKLDN